MDLRKEAMDGIVFLFQFVVPHHQDGLMKSEVMKGVGFLRSILSRSILPTTASMRFDQRFPSALRHEFFFYWTLVRGVP
jgi:hypothetical protein